MCCANASPKGRSASLPTSTTRASLPKAIGEGLSTKINVNLGVSGDAHDYTEEWQKVETALEFGAHAIMDLSNYGKTVEFRTKSSKNPQR